MEAEDHFVLRADLPGLAEDDVAIEIAGQHPDDHRSREAEHEEQASAAGTAWSAAYGSFSRSLTLPEGVNADSGRRPGSTSGVLEVRIPKPEERKPRRIAIGGHGRRRLPGAIEGTASEKEYQSSTAVACRRTSRSTPATGQPARAFFVLRARRGQDAGVRAARLHRDGQVAAGRRGGGARLRDGARQHLPPLHPAGPRARPADGRPARVHGLGRRDHHGLGRLPGVLDGPRVGRRGGQAPRAERREASHGGVLSIEEEGVRFRSYLDGAERFMGPETSMEIQAALGSDVALAFDECTPFHVSRDYTARSTERTHRWLDRCIAWHERNAPDWQLFFGIVQGGVYEDLRRESAERVSAAAVDGVAIGGSLGHDKDEMRAVVDMTARAAARAAAAAPARHRRRGRPRARDRGGNRPVRLRDPDSAGAPRDGARARPGRRWRLDLVKAVHARQPRADRGRLPLPGVHPAHARLHPLPGPGARADRACAC